jgi:hypothetical protein
MLCNPHQRASPAGDIGAEVALGRSEIVPGFLRLIRIEVAGTMPMERFCRGFARQTDEEEGSQWITAPEALAGLLLRAWICSSMASRVSSETLKSASAFFEICSGRAMAEMRLDDLREDLILALGARERFVGVGVDVDRLEGHGQKGCTTEGIRQVREAGAGARAS